MKAIIITGMSGAGKSQAIEILEDGGFFCIDNLPSRFIETFLNLCQQSYGDIQKIALVTDIRGEIFLDAKDSTLIEFKKNHPEVELFFLDANDETLVARYQESRRDHPLSGTAGNLLEAIKAERESLEPIKDIADEVINTSNIKVGTLKRRLQAILKHEEENRKPEVDIYSFGFKYASPLGADYVFDVRFLPNPFYKRELRELTGKDQEVRDYVMSFPEAQEFYKKILDLLTFVIPEFTKVSKNIVEIAIGCTGGQHRSVTFAWLLNEALKEKGYETKLRHRDINKNRLDH
ncbi:MAG: RNase adapter RapZ [Eubacteriaceae bacterium]